MRYSISNQSLNVLVLDESTDISYMLKKALFFAGHSATVFNDPEKALEHLSHNKNYEAVITDCFFDVDNFKNNNESKGLISFNKLLTIIHLPVLVWSENVDKFISYIKYKDQITLLRKPEENLPHIFKWLANIKKEENYHNDTFPIFQLIYASRVIDAFTENDLMDILNTSRQFNKTANISGALIYHSGHFLQVLEGEKSVVEALYYEHIVKDKRHSDLNILSQGEVDKRAFSNWDMGFFGSNYNEDYTLLGLTDFDQHPAGQFFKEKLTQSQKELFTNHFLLYAK